MKKPWWGAWGAGGVALAAGLYLYFYASPFWKGKPTYKTARVERGELASTISSTGTVNPQISVLVGSQVSGAIQALYADFNAVVHKGQTIAQLDPAIFQANVNQAQANVESAQADLKTVEADLANLAAGQESARAEVRGAQAEVEKDRVALKEAEVNLQRLRGLQAEGLVSNRELDTAQAAYDSAKARLKATQAKEEAEAARLRSAEAQYRSTAAKREAVLAKIKQVEASLQLARTNLSYTTIRSPVDGIVIARNVDVGQTVAASLQAPTLFTIANDLRKMQVNASVDEADVGRLRPGMSASFTVDAFPQETFTGYIAQIRNAPTLVQNVVTYDTVITVDNPQLKLKPGMTATVTITLERREQALKIPNVAFRFRPQGQGAAPQGPGIASGPPQRQARGVGRPGGTARDQAHRRGEVTDQRLRRSVVWVLDQRREPVPIPVQTGLTDGTFTELVDGALREGQEVIVGIEAGANGRGTPAAGGPQGERPRRPPGFGRFF